MRGEDQKLRDRWRTSNATYLLFASAFARDFYAVVPTYSSTPTLLLGPAWRFVRILERTSARPRCLLRQSAINAVHKQGYYLFTDRSGEMADVLNGAGRNRSVTRRRASHSEMNDTEP